MHWRNDCGQQRTRHRQYASLDRANHQEINKEEEDKQSRIADDGRVVIQSLPRLVCKIRRRKVFCLGAVKGKVLYADHVTASAVESDSCLRKFADVLQLLGLPLMTDLYPLAALLLALNRIVQNHCGRDAANTACRFNYMARCSIHAVGVVIRFRILAGVLGNRLVGGGLGAGDIA